MSDAPSTENSSAGGPSAESTPTTQQKPKSSFVGRIVIGILLVVLAVEAAATGRAYWAKSQLSDELAKAESQGDHATRETVQRILGGREPDLSSRIKVAAGEELYEVYYFNGLLKQRVLCVHYGVLGEKDADESQRELLEVLTVVPEVVLYDEVP